MIILHWNAAVDSLTVPPSVRTNCGTRHRHRCMLWVYGHISAANNREETIVPCVAASYAAHQFAIACLKLGVSTSPRVTTQLAIALAWAWSFTSYIILSPWPWFTVFYEHIIVNYAYRAMKILWPQSSHSLYSASMVIVFVLHATECIMRR